jgi:hypothetical protein
LDRDDFLILAFNAEERLLKKFWRQDEWLLSRAYVDAVAATLDKLPTIRKPLAYLEAAVKSKVNTAIVRDINERRWFTASIGARPHYERGLEYQEYGEVVAADDPKLWNLKFVDHPGVTETFGYIDFKNWLYKQDKVDAEVLLRKSTTKISHGDLGKRFGRDRHWSKRVYTRMAKRLIRETGLFPDAIESMVSEALRRLDEPPAVVQVALGRWEGRATFDYKRPDRRERRDVVEQMEDPDVPEEDLE